MDLVDEKMKATVEAYAEWLSWDVFMSFIYFY